MSSQEIAKTILAQMGGTGKISAMLGTKQYVVIDHGVKFNWPSKERSKGNCVQITLLPSDTYKMEFYNVSRTGFKLVKEYEDIYWDQLIEIFEKQTGYYLHF